VARSGAKLLDRHDGPPELVDHVFKLALATEGSNTTLGYIVEHRLPPPRGPVCDRHNGPSQRTECCQCWPSSGKPRRAAGPSPPLPPSATHCSRRNRYHYPKAALRALGAAALTVAQVLDQ